MVERVEGLKAQLQVDPVEDGEVFEDTDIEVVDAGLPQDIAAA